MTSMGNFNPAETIDDDGKITVENVNHPGKRNRVSADRYLAMFQAFRQSLPTESPGLNQNEIREAVKEHLPQDLFPGGQKVGWWAKTVQLDLEAKGLMVREDTSPLRWYLTNSTDR